MADTAADRKVFQLRNIRTGRNTTNQTRGGGAVLEYRQLQFGSGIPAGAPGKGRDGFRCGLIGIFRMETVPGLKKCSAIDRMRELPYTMKP